MKARRNAYSVALTTVFVIGSALTIAAQTPAVSAKPKISSSTGLPRFSYAISSPPSSLLVADHDSFTAFALKVLQDIDFVLNNYDITNKAILRSLYATRLNVQLLTNDNQAALSTCKKLKELNEKPEAKAASGMLDRPLIEARISARSAVGEAFLQSFRADFQAALDSLDWSLVQNSVKSMKRSFEVATPDLIVATEKEGLDPAALKSKAVDLAAAQTMIEDRFFNTVVFPLKPQALPLLTAYVAAHEAQNPAAPPVSQPPK